MRRAVITFDMSPRNPADSRPVRSCRRGGLGRLDDKRCGNETLRRSQFIHRDRAGNRQCPDRRGDQVCRWEFLFQRHFAGGVRHATSRVVVRVVS